MDWQPISTAPKDGSVILAGAFNEKGRFLCRTMWWDEEFEALVWNEDTGYTFRAAWCAGRVASWGYEEFAEEHPSHWQPLPPPPKIGEDHG